MPALHEHVVEVESRKIGFGIYLRPHSTTYYVQWRDIDGAKVQKSTGEGSRPRALRRSEDIIREYYRRTAPSPAQLTWDEVAERLERQMAADRLRPRTVTAYLCSFKLARSAGVCPAAVSGVSAQNWANEYLATTYRRTDAADAKRYPRDPRSLHSHVRQLRAVWSKYLLKRLRIVGENPWRDVDLPRLDEKPIRTLATGQLEDLIRWLTDRWLGWSFPRHVLEVKAVSGCRLMDLCSIRSAHLSADDVLTLPPTTAKSRRQRVVPLPADLAEELRTHAGPVWLWERYASEIRPLVERRNAPCHTLNPAFAPARLYGWLLDEIREYNAAHPDRPAIRSHDLRKRAVTELHRAGVDLDTAAAALGMTPGNARRYYLALDTEAAARTVLGRMVNVLRPTVSPPVSPSSTSAVGGG